MSDVKDLFTGMGYNFTASNYVQLLSEVELRDSARAQQSSAFYPGVASRDVPIVILLTSLAQDENSPDWDIVPAGVSRQDFFLAAMREAGNRGLGPDVMRERVQDTLEAAGLRYSPSSRPAFGAFNTTIPVNLGIDDAADVRLDATPDGRFDIVRVATSQGERRQTNVDAGDVHLYDSYAQTIATGLDGSPTAPGTVPLAADRILVNSGMVNQITAQNNYVATLATLQLTGDYSRASDVQNAISSPAVTARLTTNRLPEIMAQVMNVPVERAQAELARIQAQVGNLPAAEQRIVPRLFVALSAPGTDRAELEAAYLTATPEITGRITAALASEALQVTLGVSRDAADSAYSSALQDYATRYSAQSNDMWDVLTGYFGEQEFGEGNTPLRIDVTAGDWSAIARRAGQMLGTVVDPNAADVDHRAALMYGVGIRTYDRATGTAQPTESLGSLPVPPLRQRAANDNEGGLFRDAG